MRTLALAMRPKKLDSMVGLEKLVKQIRKQYQSRVPQAVLFVAETGAGKTTLARILSVALQCTHQDVFGNPCTKCYQRRSEFDIIEINAGDITGIDDLRSALAGSDYVPKPGSKYRAYILDEAQGLSRAAQTLMLKFLEDCPKTTVFFICTTDPQKLLATIVSRCLVYQIPSLSLDGVRKLVVRGLKFIECNMDADPLADELMEKGITSPRKVLQATENYASGASPEEAARVDVISIFDTHTLCRTVIKGDWPSVAKLLKTAKKEDARTIKGGVTGYLKSILLDDTVSARATAVANAIDKLTALAAHEDGMQLAGVASVLYSVTKFFKEYKR